MGTEIEMTNYECLADNDEIEIAAIKMLLERIRIDIDDDLFEINFESYPTLYKEMLNWLKSEKGGGIG